MTDTPKPMTGEEAQAFYTQRAKRWRKGANAMDASVAAWRDTIIEANRRASEHAIERCNVFVEAERAKVERLREALGDALIFIEDGESHNEGAFEPDCPVCLAAQNIRRALDAIEAALEDA